MTRRILVADDEAPIANAVAMKLRNAGFEVTVALDGQEAFERAMEDRPDFIVTDLQMPGMSGLELCARLTAELAPGIPTILLTAKGFELEQKDLAGLPIRRVMTKPFSPRELLASVQDALGEAVVL
ncbi:MAG: response regulator [Planctomycetota bacterium]|nr:response regulator [Planctomycetota bacterium]